MKRKHDSEFRHELKYYISYGDYLMLSKKLSAVLPSDAHTDENGEYHIRSLYFDDLNDASFREKLSGVDVRDKYRVRIYNKSSDVIKLERKRKVSGFIKKDSVSLTTDEYYMLSRGDFEFLYNMDSSFARSLYIEFKTRMLLPRVIVDYVREPYTFPYEDVRITFDKAIRTAFRSTDIFNPDLITYPALSNREMVLEVKFNRALPTYIWMLLQTQSPLRGAISKYCICRKYEL